jgi:sortase (surface protein transpeptidase)
MSKMGVSRKDAASVAQRQTGGTTSHKRQGRRVGVSKSPSPGSNDNCAIAGHRERRVAVTGQRCTVH